MADEAMSSVSGFFPMCGPHAVVSCEISVSLAPKEERSLFSKIEGRADELAECFSASDEIYSVIIAKGEPPRLEKSGKIFSVGPEQQKDWTVHISEEILKATCHQYTRWNMVEAELRKLLRYALEIGEYAGTDLRNISLKVVDQFCHEKMDDDRYDISCLLSRSSRYLNPLAFAGNKIWHCNSGWFAVSGNNVRCLNHLNVSAVDGSLEDEGEEVRPVYSVMIEHIQSVKASDLDLSGTIFADDHVATVDAMQWMHKSNKSVMVDLLQENKLRQIGLKWGEE